MDSQQQADPMEVVVQKHELVRQLQFPPGFRFVPTEVELVDVYLRGKIEGRKLPLDVVNEVIILEWQPGRLVETYKAYGEQKWYFFTAWEPSSSNKEKEPNRQVRVEGVKATWKATGSVTEIHRKGKDRKPVDMVGTKRVLIYHSSDADEDGKWSMHEYVLTSNSEIGQYVLCSIQRKQHSDTEDNAGESSGSSKRKSETTNMEPGKRTKIGSTPTEEAQQPKVTPQLPKKTTKRTKKASTQAERARRMPRKTKTTRRKKKGSTEVEEAQQHQQLEITPRHVPTESPLMPPEHHHQMLQQEQSSVAFDATDLPAVPLGYPSDGNLLQLRASAVPTHAGHSHAHTFQQCGDMAQFSMQNHLGFCEQGEQPPSLLPWGPYISPDSNGDLAQHQLSQQESYGWNGVPNQQDLYTGQYLRQNVDLFSGNTTLNNSNWELGQDQFYLQENEGAFGVHDQHTHGQYYQSYEQWHGGVFEQTAGTGYGGLNDQFTERSVQDAGGAAFKDYDTANVTFPGDGFIIDIEYFLSILCDAPKAEDGVGTQEDSNNPALQRKHELLRPCGQQQHEYVNGHVCSGPSSGCLICLCP